MIGRTLSHYTVLEKLGGMGAVYKARDNHLNHLVILKALPPERVAGPERERRWVREVLDWLNRYLGPVK
jgi:serine/threonine protein kinase